MEAKVEKVKGELNGLCNRSACLSPNNVIYYNHSTRAYYCPSCAKAINEVNPEAYQMFGHALCTLDKQAVVVRIKALDTLGSILMLERHETDRNKPGWCLPGGEVEEGEKYLDAALRELKEETGLQHNYATYIGSYISDIKGIPAEVHVFEIIYDELDFNIKISDEHKAFSWISPGAIEVYNTTNQLAGKTYTAIKLSKK